MDFYDEIYYSLVGQLEEDFALPWVPDAFGAGGDCAAAYARLVEARNRVSEKLGKDDDPDLCRMLDEMVAIQRILCRRVMELRRL